MATRNLSLSLSLSLDGANTPENDQDVPTNPTTPPSVWDYRPGVLGRRPTQQHRPWARFSALGLESRTVVSLDTHQPNNTAPGHEFPHSVWNYGPWRPWTLTDQPNNTAPGHHVPHSVWNYRPWCPWPPLNPATQPLGTIFLTRSGTTDRGVLEHRSTQQHRPGAPCSSLGLELRTVVSLDTDQPSNTAPGHHVPHSVWNYGPWCPWTPTSPAAPPPGAPGLELWVTHLSNPRSGPNGWGELKNFPSTTPLVCARMPR